MYQFLIQVFTEITKLVFLSFLVRQSWQTVETVIENKITKMSITSVFDFTFFNSPHFMKTIFIEYISAFAEW